MGGYEQVNPVLPEMPKELGRTRDYISNYMKQGLENPATAPMDMSYKPSGATMDAGAMIKYLLGGSASSDAGGTPTPRTGAYPPGDNAYDKMPVPGILGDTQNMLKEGMATGFRTDTDPLYQARRATMLDNLKKNIAQTMQDQVLKNARPGSGSARLVGEQTGTAERGFAADTLGLEANMQEAASNRRLQAGQQSTGVADMLMKELMNRIGMSSSYGQQEFQNTQTMQDKAYQEWLRKQPGYSPLFSGMLNYATSYPFQAQVPGMAEPAWMGLLKGLISGGSAMGAAALMPA